MTATTTEAQASIESSPPSGLLLPAFARSEWTKLRSVRSTYWTLITALLAGIGLDAAACANFAGNYPHMSAQDRSGFEPVGYSLNGLFVAQIAIGALGVLVMTSEYGTGMIRTSLTAAPQRRRLLTAKVLVFTLVALLAGELASVGAFTLGQAILSTQHLGVSLTDPGVARPVLGGGLYLAGVGLLGLAIGAVLRHTAGALAVFFGVLFGASIVAALLPGSWRRHALKYMPINAGSQILTRHPGTDALSPWTGYGLLLLYAGVVLAAAYLLIARRDA